MIMPTLSGHAVLTLLVTLEDVKPKVWRRLPVPSAARLDKLPHMVQAAMGWEDCHLHSFEVGDALFGMQDDDGPDEEMDEKSVTIAQAIEEERTFFYEYDFGDSWRHEIVVESVARLPFGL